ncbi:hypothetical protein AAHE18_01G128800 [Arachis hypogaea]
MDNENIEDMNLEDRTNVIHDSEFQVNQITSTGLYHPEPIQILTHVMEELRNRQNIYVTSLSCVTMHQLYLLELLSQYRPRKINDTNLERELRHVIRMGPEAFRQLCQKLRETGRVKDSTRSTIEEQVTKFLHIIGYDVKTRTMYFFFHRSGETISRHFHNVLHDCIGAIDETRSRVKVPRVKALRFCGRKDHLTQNILAACGFDMKFTYVLFGKFYLSDVGFMLKPGILTSYRGVRYHLKEYSICEPQNPKELFYNWHSSLKNVIERWFGVQKKRFPIITGATEPCYSFKTMRGIFLACCILHNFFMGVDIDQSIIDAIDRKMLQECNIDISQSNQRDEEYRHVALLRDDIAAEIWNVHQTL